MLAGYEHQMLLGLAGGYCAGKNEVARILAARGWTCIDADAMGHEAVEMARDEIVRRFGAAVLGRDGRVDRRALARLVFADPAALADQEAIVHPIAIRLVEEAAAAAEEAARAAGAESRVCVNAALLHRAGDLASRCDAILEVRAPLIARVARGLRRDRAGIVAVLRRITRQRGFRGALRAAAAGRPILVLRNWRGTAALVRSLDRALARAAASGR
jgi:dephospho-CoA kinase